MIPDLNIYHIYPTNDPPGHITTSRQNVLGLFCDCPCLPEIHEEHGKYFIVHSSWDGREGLEQALGILSNPIT
jgi:hypothetical protein